MIVESDLRAIRKNPGTRLIIAQEAELRRRIRRDPQLAEDFDFLVRKTGWRLHRLLQLLYWDSNMMHADPQTVLGGAKRDAWPIDRKTLKAILRDISALAEQVEQVNKTEFSPARSPILQNGAGLRILRKEEKYLLKTFGDLPGILRFYCGELKRKLKITDNFWPFTACPKTPLLPAPQVPDSELPKFATLAAHNELFLGNNSRSSAGGTPMAAPGQDVESQQITESASS